MKINNTHHFQTCNFGAGLTKKIRLDIQSCDPKMISSILAKQNIKTSFKENKYIAWLTLTSIKIIDNINKQFGLNLQQPKGIFVENFENLKTNPNSVAFTNFAPTNVYKYKDAITDECTIFVNEFTQYNYSNGNYFWEKIDEIADLNFENKSSTTNNFMETFIHECAHVLHQYNLLQSMSGNNYVKYIQSLMTDDATSQFKSKFKDILKPLCEYASTNPFETIACDLSKRIILNLDEESFRLKNDILKNSPYEHRILFQIFKVENDKDKLCRNIWNGKFKIN